VIQRTRFGIHRDTVSEIIQRQGVARRLRGIAPTFLEGIIDDCENGASLVALGSQLVVSAPEKFPLSCSPASSAATGLDRL
jgi:hypothetical protein